MNNTPTFSIIIPTYNQSSYLQSALLSVCRQTNTDWEAIVVNNFSIDDTIKVVEKINDSRIKLYNFNNNGIIAASRNYAISVSSGKYLAFLDSDDLWFLDKLETSLEYLDAGFDLVCHGLCWFGERGKRDCFYGPASRATFESLLFNGNCIATSATVVKRAAVNSVGRFSEDTNIVTAEDYHLWLKLSKTEIKFGFIKKILGGYRIHSNNSSNPLKQAAAVKYVVNQFLSQELGGNLISIIRMYRRNAIIDYSVGRRLQIDGRFSYAQPHFINSIIKYPLLLKAYIAMILNFFQIRLDGFKYKENSDVS